MVDISKISDGTNTYDIKDSEARSELSNKQDTLVSGTNIKTINGNSVLGNGDLTIGGSVDIDEETITKNTNNELQVSAIINPNTNSGAISPLKVWNGTEQQWNQGESTTWYYWQTSTTALWTSGGSLPSSASWRSVTYGDGKFVAVASSSDKSAYSTDGINWSASTLPSSASWVSVTYGNGKFVAVASNSDKATYSTDGINWTSGGTLPSSEDWYSVTYGDGKFVAVASNSDKATYSTDGINWTASTLPSYEVWYLVTYGDGKFVAVVYNSNISAYSIDGINWTSGGTLPSSEKWYSVTYGDGKFVAVAAGSDKAAYSTDGINWTASTMPSSAEWESVTYGDGKFVAVAFSSDKSAYSTDGINWTASTMPSSAKWRSMTYGDGKFVAKTFGSDTTAIFTMSDKCYTLDQIPTTSSQVYSVPETTSTKTITSVGSGTITLSDTLTYNYTSSGNQNTYRTIGDAHPDWLSNIDNVGVKIGNTIVATVGPDTSNMQTTTNLVTSVSSSSTDTQYPSAKCVYDIVGDIEALINAL